MEKWCFLPAKIVVQVDFPVDFKDCALMWHTKLFK